MALDVTPGLAKTCSPLPEKMRDRLAGQTLAFRKRTLTQKQGIDLSSNDYLGFSEDPILAERILKILSTRTRKPTHKGGGPQSFPMGAAGSRLLRGNLDIHEEAEGHLAKFCNRDAALLFPSGYQANLGLISAILGPGDSVFSDELNHASLIDGIRLSRAERAIYPHRDMAALESDLAKHHEAKKNNSLRVIVTESIFSMDGDQAPLPQLAALAKEYEALLVVDESHATGLWGSSNQAPTPDQAPHEGGGGLVQALGLSNSVFATVHTGGKSLGCSGAWIACDAALKDYLVNFSRPFIFSTAPSPALAVSLIEACKHWFDVGPERAKEVHTFSSSLRNRLLLLQEEFKNQIRIPSGSSPIVPLIVSDNGLTLGASQFLQGAGYDVRAIRPPTVPEGTARLRITTPYDTLAGGFDQSHFIGHLRKFLEQNASLERNGKLGLNTTPEPNTIPEPSSTRERNSVLTQARIYNE